MHSNVLSDTKQVLFSQKEAKDEHFWDRLVNPLKELFLSKLFQEYFWDIENLFIFSQRI